MTTLRVLWRLARPYKRQVALLLGIGLVTTVIEALSIGLLFPLLGAMGGSDLLDKLPKALADYFKGLSSSQLILLVGILLPVFWILRNAIGYATSLLASRLGLLVNEELQGRAYRRVTFMDYARIAHGDRGDIGAMMTYNPSRTGLMVQQAAMQITPLCMMLLYLAGLVLLSWKLTLISVVVAIIQTQAFTPLNRMAARANRRLRDTLAVLGNASYEIYDGQREIRLYGQEERFLERMLRSRRTYFSAAFRAEAINAIATPAFSSLTILVIGGVMIVSSFVLAEAGTAWVQVLVMFLVFAFRLNNTFGQLSSARTAISGNVGLAEDLLRFLDSREKADLASGTRRMTKLISGIELQGVSFSYDPGDPRVLDDVSLFIPQNQITAIVGPSGAGKTTITNLLVRLYDPQEGRIMVDGIDLQEYELRSWRDKIGLISQDTFLFRDTMANNIAFGRPDAPAAAVQRAATLAEIDGFIRSLPHGYETVRGDRGLRLSGGQRQRIAMARALLIDPEILIMDEATSNLDSETEAAILESIRKLKEDHTIIVIAHRLSTVRHADKIVVIDNGRKVEEGTHEELMARRDRYYSLVQAQAIGERAPEPSQGRQAK
ncbi:MAG: ABC transporter ATP-binding protein [Chloroflexi bacterium]|nr:ABC transporter ATP-binding protein [Chloroflexota bacterium]